MSGRLQLRLGGLETLESFRGDFDAVYSVNDRRAALAAIRAVMRPGGLLATTYQPRHSGAKSADAFSFAERLSREMRQLGFSDIRVEQLDLHPMPAMCVLGRRGE